MSSEGGPAREFGPPVAISVDHDVGPFSSGNDELDRWLRERALKSEGRSARTYVVCGGPVVVGYYCLATGAVAHEAAPGRLKRNMPNPIPVVVIGRLAVDRRHHGLGVGRGLLRDALARTLALAEIAGTRAVLVHAIDADAVKFYRHFEFVEFPSGSRTMFLPIETLQTAAR